MATQRLTAEKALAQKGPLHVDGTLKPYSSYKWHFTTPWASTCRRGALQLEGGIASGQRE